MLRKEDHFIIGKLNKPRGVNGEFNVSFLPNYVLEDFIDVVLVEYDNYLVPFFVEDVSVGKENNGYIKFDHIHKVEDCTPFVNCKLYAPANHRIKVDVTPDASALMGYLVQDENEMELGRVIDFINNPNNPLLEIENASDNFLMPYVANFIINIDNQKKILTVKLPEGLINLNE